MDVSERATARRAAADSKKTSDPENETEARHIRIVLLGKTGIGKSSFAGTMFGENVFEIHHTANSGTSKCQTATGQVGDENITVIDTPGIFDNHMSDEDLRSQIINTIIESSDGIDAFLILFKVERFTEQENDIVSKIKAYFSEEAFRHAVVVFTHGDQLHDNTEIEEFFSGNQYLSDLLEKCGNRCCVVDNKYWKNNQQDEYRNNQVQVERLIETVKDMVKSGGRYTNEMLQEVNRMINQLAQLIGRSAGGMSNEDIRSQARIIVSDVFKKLAGVTTGVLLGAFLGVPHLVVPVILALKNHNARTHHYGSSVAAASDASGVTLRAAAGAYVAAGAAVGGYIGYQEGKNSDSVMEAVNNTAEVLMQPVRQAFKGPNITHKTQRN